MVGLGDAAAALLSSVGITKERVNNWIGAECGCAERQEKMNKFGAWVHKAVTGGFIGDEHARTELEAAMVEPRPKAILNTSHRNVPLGAKFKLNWATQNASSVMIDGSKVDVKGSVEMIASQEGPRVFTLLAKGPGGEAHAVVAIQIDPPLLKSARPT